MVQTDVYMDERTLSIHLYTDPSTPHATPCSPIPHEDTECAYSSELCSIHTYLKLPLKYLPSSSTTTLHTDICPEQLFDHQRGL